MYDLSESSDASVADDLPPQPPPAESSLLQAASILGSIQRPGQLLDLILSSEGVGPDDPLVPVAAPAAPLSEPVQRGDLLVRAAPGGSRVHSAVILSPAESAEALRARGVPVEASGGGAYVEVMEVPYGGGSPRVVGRRLTDSWGRVPRGEAILRPTPTQSAREETPEVGLDEVSTAQIDWCRMRQTIVATARAEEARWTSPTGAKLLENAASQRPFLVSYWMTVPGSTTAASAGAQAALSAGGTDERGFWSAAFICFVMHAAGIRQANGFEFGAAHIRYIVGALRNRERSDTNRPFWLVDHIELRAEATPAPGDLLCFNRANAAGVMSTHTYSSLRRQFWVTSSTVVPSGRSHCALIVGTVQRAGRRFLETIGGNETNSVRVESTIPLEANGGLSDATIAARNIFGMIKITRC